MTLLKLFHKLNRRLDNYLKELSILFNLFWKSAETENTNKNC